MAFQFRLEKVLEYRHRLEKEAQKRYYEAQAATEVEREKLKAFYQSIDQARGRAQELLSIGGSSDLMYSLQDTEVFIKGQYIRIERQRLQLREAKQREEMEQEKLIAAMKDRKILEKLREQKKKEYEEKRGYEAAKAADDMNVIRDLQKRRGEGP